DLISVFSENAETIPPLTQLRHWVSPAIAMRQLSGDANCQPLCISEPGWCRGSFTAIVAIRRTDAISLTVPGFGGGVFFLSSLNREFFRWFLQHTLRLVHHMTLMTIGLYNEPAGSYMPSVLY